MNPSPEAIQLARPHLDAMMIMLHGSQARYEAWQREQAARSYERPTRPRLTIERDYDRRKHPANT